MGARVPEMTLLDDQAVPEPADEGAAPTLEVAPEAPAAPSTPSVADGVVRPLDPRSVKLDRTVGWITNGAIALGLLAAVTIVRLAGAPEWVQALLAGLWVVVALALVWLAHRWPVLHHRHAAYRVDDQGIEIRRGVFWRKVINVPRSRVQHTDVSQGPLERGHGLGTLVIYTAGTSFAKVELGGLDHGTALAIRDHLLPRGSGDAV